MSDGTIFDTELVNTLRQLATVTAERDALKEELSKQQEHSGMKLEEADQEWFELQQTNIKLQQANAELVARIAELEGILVRHGLRDPEDAAKCLAKHSKP